MFLFFVSILNILFLLFEVNLHLGFTVYINDSIESIFAFRQVLQYLYLQHLES
jgi:hypothetical protein